MPTFVFTQFASKRLLKLDVQTQNRILKKLEELKADNDWRSIKAVRGLPPVTHRLRVGDYRLVMELTEGDEFKIIDVDHRSRIYR